MTNHTPKKIPRWQIIISPVLGLLAAALIGLVGFTLFFSAPYQAQLQIQPSASVQITAALDQTFDSWQSDTAQLLRSYPKRYWIPESAEIAPKPKQSCYGQTDDPASLQWLLDEAASILDGQSIAFSVNTPIMPGSTVYYYLDETIFAITWKQVFENFVYTMSEVKIVDASQLRRYIAGNTYGSPELYVTSQMAAMNNAVVASSGDFYVGRPHGLSVYEGKVYKANNLNIIDTCFIDQNGDLLLSYAGSFSNAEEAQKYVDEHNVKFSVSFGPIFIDNYELVNTRHYALGEADDTYPRAALCQMGKLHYLVVVANLQGIYRNYPTLRTFTEYVHAFGCEKGYCLDGGQTGVIVTNNKVINDVQFHFERKISDIFYFVTAMPNPDNE